MLGAAARQVVEDLVGRHTLAALDGHPLLHVVGVEIADAVIDDLAVAPESLEGLDRLGEGDRAAPVQQVDVDPIGLEPLQAALAGLDRGTLAGVVRIDLADDEQLVAPAADRFGNRLLRTALAIHLRRVDQGHAEIDGELDGGDFLGAARAVFAHAPGADSEGRHARTGGKRIGTYVQHGGEHLAGCGAIIVDFPQRPGQHGRPLPLPTHSVQGFDTWM